jgi:hypothetical protein
MIRQSVKRFGDKIMRQLMIGARLAALRETLLDKGCGGVQKLCRRIIGLPHQHKRRCKNR